jgi:hypothetical protein
MSALLVVVALSCPAPASAAPSDAKRRAAAAAYDEGTDLFERAQFAAAAQAFLRADNQLPSSDAVSSALVSARKSNDHLLVVQVAERAIARESADPKLAATARQALLEAARHLSLVDLDCAPKPCALMIDGASAEPGSQYLLPGTRSVVATAAGAEPAEERLRLEAGASYRIVLHPVAPGAAATPSEVKTTRDARAAHNSPPREGAESARKPLPPVAFYVGAAVTVVLAVATTWSGLDTLSARNDLPDRATESDIDEVKGKIRRTDILLGGSVLAGALTTYAGLALVDWRGPPPAKHGTLGPVQRGAVMTVTGHF